MNPELEFDSQAEAALDDVRELSERWHHRPAPKKLFCIPVRTYELKPIPIWKRQLRLMQLARAGLVSRHSSLAPE